MCDFIIYISFISYIDSTVLNTINITIQYNKTIIQNHLVFNTSIIRNNSPRSCEVQYMPLHFNITF